jgi:hypothetical protein
MDQFEIVYRGSPNSLTNPADIIVIREKQPWQTTPTPDPKGNWKKYYGYGDGSIRLFQQPDSNFDDYEKQHMIPSVNQ